MEMWLVTAANAACTPTRPKMAPIASTIIRRRIDPSFSLPGVNVVTLRSGRLRRAYAGLENSEISSRRDGEFLEAGRPARERRDRGRRLQPAGPVVCPCQDVMRSRTDLPPLVHPQPPRVRGQRRLQPGFVPGRPAVGR